LAYVVLFDLLPRIVVERIGSVSSFDEAGCFVRPIVVGGDTFTDGIQYAFPVAGFKK